MIHRDFVLQLIKQAGAMLQKALGLRLADKKNEAQASIKQACSELLHLDAGLLLALPGDSLRELLSIDEGQAMGKCVVAADILAEQAELSKSQGRMQEAQDCRAKAHRLYLSVLALPGGKEHLACSERFRLLMEAGQKPSSNTV